MHINIKYDGGLVKHTYVSIVHKLYCIVIDISGNIQNIDFAVPK